MYIYSIIYWAIEEFSIGFTTCARTRHPPVLHSTSCKTPLKLSPLFILVSIIHLKLWNAGSNITASNTTLKRTKFVLFCIRMLSSQESFKLRKRGYFRSIVIMTWNLSRKVAPHSVFLREVGEFSPHAFKIRFSEEIKQEKIVGRSGNTLRSNAPSMLKAPPGTCF